MSNRLTRWLSGRSKDEGPVTLEEVVPQHPNEYPARHLKEILDERREDFEERASHPTGMPDGPGPLT